MKLGKETFKEHVKEISLVAISFALIGFGYANYNPEDIVEVASYENDMSLGDAQFVSSNVVEENAVLPNNNEILQNTIVQTATEQDYFTNTKLERENMCSQMLETYQKMVENDKITNEQKAIAIQEISKITQDKNAIMIAENLIRNKGYENVVVLKNGENVNIIVKAKKLETEDIAKIQNIVTRELNIQIDKVNISCK